MAEGIRYVCSECGRSVEAWSDGNPYYIDENGQEIYMAFSMLPEIHQRIALESLK